MGTATVTNRERTISMTQGADIPSIVVGRVFREFAASWPHPLDLSDWSLIIVDLSQSEHDYQRMAISRENVEIAFKARSWLLNEGYISMLPDSNVELAQLTEKAVSTLQS